MPSRASKTPSLAVVGGGPAGLISAEVARAQGIEVDLYERMGSVGRKFLIAGKGGLNLTHSEARPAFDARYYEQRETVGRWLDGFDAQALREWARGLGVETIIGSSGRVFPADLKAAPLLRGWVRRLRAQGLRFHVEHECTGLRALADGYELSLRTSAGERLAQADAVLLALGGASWPELGSNGRWTGWLQGLPIRALRPANCGFEVDWSEHFSSRFAGAPLKPVIARYRDASGSEQSQQGELMITAQGLEGGLLYALSAGLREVLEAQGSVQLVLDLAPQRGVAELQRAIASPRGKRSMSEHLRRTTHLDALRVGLLHEALGKDGLADAQRTAETIKRLPLTLLRTRPIEEAISSAGGVRLDALDDALMSRTQPGLFCAGEMLDWEAPTGGYLLTACFASGHRAGMAAARWLLENTP